MNQVDRTVPVAQRQRAIVENPFGEMASPAASALVSIEQQRAIAEVQARMIIARANPRNPVRCMDAILRQCARPSLAEHALYAYSRGGSEISGPSIRLAEAMAQSWGNIASGIKEIGRSNGYSECVAYAWDLETGYYDERQFQVKHWRDTKKGGYAITDERDIYELIANMGQRRKRAVLLTVIPGDVADAAVRQCEETLQTHADTSPDAVRALLEAFLGFGVTKGQIEARIQRRAESILPAQVLQLRKIWASIRDEMSTAADWFDPLSPEEAGQKVAPPSAAPAHTPTPRRAARTAESSAAPVVTPPAPLDEPPPPMSEEASLEDDGRFLAGDPDSHFVIGGPGEDEFSVYLTVPNGPGQWRETTDEPITSPVVFARSIADHPSADLGAIFAENADAIDAACALSENAKGILDDLRAAIAGLLGAAQPAAPQPIDPTAYRTPAGSFHAANYRAACQGELDHCTTSEAIDAWEELNSPVYSRSIAATAEAKRVVRAARQHVGGGSPQAAAPDAAPTPPAEAPRRERRAVAPDAVSAAQTRHAEAPQAPPVDRMSRSADSAISGLQGHPNAHSVATYTAGGVWTSVRSSCVAASRDDLVLKMDAAKAEAMKGPFGG